MPTKKFRVAILLSFFFVVVVVGVLLFCIHLSSIVFYRYEWMNVCLFCIHLRSSLANSKFGFFIQNVIYLALFAFDYLLFDVMVYDVSPFYSFKYMGWYEAHWSIWIYHGCTWIEVLRLPCFNFLSSYFTFSWLIHISIEKNH